MVSILPLPGGFIAHANRSLSPAIVSHFMLIINMLRALLPDGYTGSRKLRWLYGITVVT